MYFSFIFHEIFTVAIETDTIINFILKLEKWRLDTVKVRAQSHRNQQQS